ncbi:protein BZZ1-like [Xenia sp. Carnegie-2017]|uniref:protein BZZ1-like n=1 Tax=Xenia sp. Carnegie-2017 TaxID=2897299 RepID=UPI001F0332C5|nr:protein BZZ1-like [Xenia sp. Carnegie-2017]
MFFSQGIFCGISNTWDSLLKDTEAEAKELLEISQKLVSSISVPLFDRASKKKNLLKKIFTYRENLEIQLDKKEDSLNKCLKDYTESWSKYKLYSKDPQKEQHVSTICFNCHNDYVWQLSGFNKSNEVLYEILIPELLKDCQDTLNDIGVSYSSLMLKFNDIQQEKLKNRLENMQVIKAMFSSINAHNDISNYVQTLDSCSSKVPFRSHDSPDDTQTTDPLGVKILLNPLTEPALKRKYYLMSEKLSDVVNLVDKDQTALKSLMQLKNSYIDNPSYGNPDGMHEDVLKNDFELKQKRLQLAVLTAQLKLFSNDMVQEMGPMESAIDSEENETNAYSVVERENEKAAHQFVPYAVKKPGLCAYCKGVLFGIGKPTVRCKICKLIVHQKCEINMPYCTGAPQQRPLSKFLALRSKSIDSRTSVYEEENDEDNHLYSDIGTAHVTVKPKRRHSGKIAEERSIFVNGSYGSSANIVPSPPVIPAKPPLKKKPQQCVILYDYDATSEGDLTVKAGQRMTLINSSSSDWWEGSYKGSVGFFPASYAMKVREKEVILKCLYDFDGEEEDELSISEGQILVLIEDEGNGWMVGRAVDGEGIFPSTYVERFSKI